MATAAAAAPPPPPPEPVSSTRLYLGNLPPHATKADVESHFGTQSSGKILEVKLMTGFGFIEYEDSMDARDVVPAFHGSDFMGNRLIVQFARGSRAHAEQPARHERQPPRTRRTVYRMSITGLTPETSWQDLKDFARTDGLDVVYSEVSRDRDGKGFVEYETDKDLESAVEKLDGSDIKGATVQCVADIQAERPRDRFRSRSPPRRGGYGQGGYGYGHGPPPPPAGYYDDYYDRRGPPPPPPRGYDPRAYRERSPPRRYYEEDRRGGYGRSPPPPMMPRRGPPMDDYGHPPPRGRYPPDDYPPPRPYGRGPPPPPPPYADDHYANGYRGGYDRPPMQSPPDRRRSTDPPPHAYESYDRNGANPSAGGY